MSSLNKQRITTVVTIGQHRQKTFALKTIQMMNLVIYL